ncbi:hypothetical protein ACFYUD_36170 [Nocardia tengchongensis]|uniref:hypothetical protein n=1 Tax=Nocardia tengchongensis TaxID=2055889 RepID=UPI0036BD5330
MTDNQSVGAELIGLAVAGVGVVGTLGATVAAQWAGFRGKRLDAEIQRDQHAEQRLQSRMEQQHEQKQSAYSAFNTAARNYRMYLHHCVIELERGGQPDRDGLEAARESYREIYAQAQMVIPDRVLEVSAELDRCLANTYRVIHNTVDRTEAERLDKLHRWLDGPVLEAVWLLRQVLREDLGVTSESPDLHVKVAALASARAEQFDNGAGGPICRLQRNIGT